MPRLSPFRGIRFTGAGGPPSALLAPPYDVIDEDEAEALRERSPHNAVRLVLPEGDPPGRYELAAARLREWLEEGILAEEGRPAVYVYRQEFELGGERLERLSFFAALALSPFAAGEVLPHERTHAGPKRDRLALTLACGAQLSPIFVVARDVDGRLPDLLRRAEEEGEEVLTARTADGIGHRLVALPADALALRLCERAGIEPLLIADGHHRYETALAVADRLRREAARSVLACIVPESDPGLRVLPTHRALSEAPGGGWEAALAGAFESRPLAVTPERAARELAGRGSEGALALLRAAGAGGGRGGEAATAALLVPRPGALAEAGVDARAARVGSVVFERLVLGPAFGLGPEEAVEAGILGYHRDPGDALRAAGPDGAAFLLPPMDVADIRAAVQDGTRLPPKTTYFAPKVPSGLVFRRV